MRKNLWATVVLLALSGTCYASDVYVKPMIQMGITGGGDTLETYQYTDGSSSSISAGSLLEFGGGIEIGSVDSPFTGTVSLNYHWDSTDSNADYTATFTRWPVEFMGYYNPNRYFRMGIGARYVVGAQLQEDVGPSVDYNNTLGTVFEIGYKFSRHAVLSLRYVNEQYTPSDTSVHYDSNNNAYVYKKVDGSHVGLFGQFTF